MNRPPESRVKGPLKPHDHEVLGLELTVYYTDQVQHVSDMRGRVAVTDGVGGGS